MSFLRGFLTSPSEEQKQHGGVETIEKLCDRLETATLLDDRRDAIRALRALSKTYQVEVGTHAMDLLVKALLDDSSDIEAAEMVVETLLNVMATPGDETPADTEIGVQFTEIFVKSEANITLLLSLLEEYDFHIRWPVVKLLILLLKNRSKDLQDKVLESPMGISKLMDLLSDSREIIRNDGLLLMIKLTKNNPAIQKIVAFENAFERLLMIVSSEGFSDGGIVVEDCLNLLLNLLKNNLSNQNFFRETSNIQRIAPFFEIDLEEDDEKGKPVNMAAVWNVQKQTNILLMLDVLQVLISPTNNQQSVISAQKVIYTRGIFMQLMDLLLYPNLPPDIFAKLLVTIGDTIRGNAIIQQFMDELELSDRKAVVLILMFMVNDKQPFKTRLAALYCVQCFLFKNGKGQESVISTLLPNQEDVPTGVTSGQLLCAGLFSCDDVAHWLCSVTLSHCLYNNVAQHNNMLHVQLELTPGHPPVHLISQVFNMLVKEENQRTTFGTLILMCHWAEECPDAVNKLLEIPNFVPYLLEQIENHDSESQVQQLQSRLCALLLGMCLKYNDNTSPQYSKTNLLHLITHRVGIDSYTEILESTNVSPHFTQASKSAHPTASVPLDMVLDYSFTKLYKKQQDIVIKALEGEEEPEPGNDIETHDLIVNSYKDLIKQQDDELHKLRAELEQLRSGAANTNQPNQHQGIQELTSDSQQQLPTESQAIVAQYAEQITQLQQYITEQDTRYKQYIAQLQTWFNEQLEQAKNHQVGANETGNLVNEASSQLNSGDDELQNKYDTLRHDKQVQDQYVSELVNQIEQLEMELAGAVVPEEKRAHPETETLVQTSAEHDQLVVDLKLRDELCQKLEAELSETKSKLAQSENQNLARFSELEAKLTENECENQRKVNYLESKLIESETESKHKISCFESKLAEKEVESEQKASDLERIRLDNENLTKQLKKVSEVQQADNRLADYEESIRILNETIANLEIEVKRLEKENAAFVEKVNQEKEETKQLVETQETATTENTGYMYDYSQWFTPVVADDGATYYQSTDGHLYNEEQYRYTIDQYEQYYRQQAVDQQTQQQETQQIDSQQQTERLETNSQQQTESLETDNQHQQTDCMPQQKTEIPLQFDYQQQTDVQQNMSDSEQQINSLCSELETARKEIAHLKKLLEKALRNDKSDRISKLSQSVVSNHTIEVDKKTCEKTEINVISIENADPASRTSPDTPDMNSDPSEHNDLVPELQALQEKFDNLSTEQDDLLVLLAHQDKQLATLKARLRDHGDSISVSDSDDDFDDLLDNVDDVPNASELTRDGRLAS